MKLACALCPQSAASFHKPSVHVPFLFVCHETAFREARTELEMRSDWICSIDIPWFIGQIVQDENVVRGVLALYDRPQMAHDDLSPGSWLERIGWGLFTLRFCILCSSSIMYLGPMHLDR